MWRKLRFNDHLQLGTFASFQIFKKKIPTRKINTLNEQKNRHC